MHFSKHHLPLYLAEFDHRWNTRKLTDGERTVVALTLTTDSPVSHISLRFNGNGVAPATTRCKELATVIAATEDLIASMMEEPDEDDASSFVSLVAVEDKSLSLKFAPFQVAAGMALWLDMAAMINTSNFERLNPKAREYFSEIVAFVKRKGCSCSLGDSQRGVTATFDYNIALPSDRKLKGRTSLFGEVMRVGGEEPIVRLRLPSGKAISCETNETVAKELGHRLYEAVTCKGTATWDWESGTILKFRIESVSTFQQSSVSEAFESLAKAMPQAISRLKAEGPSNPSGSEPEGLRTADGEGTGKQPTQGG